MDLSARAAFAGMVAACSFADALVLTLAGRTFAGFWRGPGPGALSAGLGLLIVYPLVVVMAPWASPPSCLLALGVLAAAGVWRVVRRGGRAGPLTAAAVRDALVLTVLGVFFWWPAVAGARVGLFTEASGDLTIYAGLPARAGAGGLWAGRSLADHLRQATDTPALTAAAEPPAAGWSMQRIRELGWGMRSTGWFALQHALFAVPLASLEARYLALLAVLWAAVVAALVHLAAAWGGRRAAVPAFLILAGAHGLASAGYNHYLPQLLGAALLASALALIGLPRDAQPLSAAGLLGLMVTTSVALAIAYFPLGPLVAAPLVAAVAGRGSALVRESAGDWRAAGWRSRALASAAGGVLALGLAAALVAQAPQMGTFARRFLGSARSEALTGNLAWLGPPRAPGPAHVAVLFGAFGLQRLPPYHSRDPVRRPAFWLVLAGGGLALAAAACRVAAIVLRRPPLALRQREALRWGLAAAATLLLTGGATVFLGRGYDYTQHKALAYAMPLCLSILVLPLGALGTSRFVAAALSGQLLLAAGLAAFRVEGGVEIARQEQRAGILDAGLRDLLSDVAAEDPAAFVLAYPPSAAALSLWELGMRDTRGLLMRHYAYPQPRESYVTPADVGHLWLVGDGRPETLPGRALTAGSLWAYRPLAGTTCRVVPSPTRADAPQEVKFSLVPEGVLPLWYVEDHELWVFRSAPTTLVLALKEHEALREAEVPVEIRYPVRTTLRVPVRRRGADEAVAEMAGPAELAGAPLVVVRLPGKGYSSLVCAGAPVARMTAVR